MRSGKVRYVGVSNYTGWQLATAKAACEVPLVSTQVEYSLVERGVEREVAPAAAHHGVGLLPWAPLGRGVLTGKYRNGTPSSSRAASPHYAGYVEHHRTDRANRIVQAVVTAADGLGVSPLEVALAWVRDRPGVVAPVVGAKGRVLAEDIQPQVRDALSDRVQREHLDNVAVKLGTPDDPMLPAQSFDRILLVHMYHEVQSPYAFLWHAREGLKPDGEVILVDSNRPVKRHGIPPAQAKCEFAALGLEPVKYSVLSSGEVYLMAFRAARPRPQPDQIRPCAS